MGMHKISRNRENFLFNGRAYMSINNSTEKLSELEKELKSIGYEDEYPILFQLEILYDFYKYQGLPANTVSVVAQLEIGNRCLIKANINIARITRLSESFCSIEWR